MTTQPDNLPFIKDPAFDYILTDDDRQKFEPRLTTDDFWSELGWKTTTNKAGLGFSHGVFYRRRKTTGWVSVKQRLPGSDGRYVCTFVAGGGMPWSGQGWFQTNPPRFEDSSVTHWQEFPTPPQPPKPAEEVAFEEWYKSTWPDAKALGLPATHYGSCRTSFLAAIEWAKDHKEAL